MEMLNKRLYYDTINQEFYLVNHKLKIYMRISKFGDKYHMLCLVMAYGDWNYAKEHIVDSYERVHDLIRFGKLCPAQEVTDNLNPKTIEELTKYLSLGRTIKLVQFKGMEMNKIETVEFNSDKMILTMGSPIVIALHEDRIHFTEKGFEVIAMGDDLIKHPLVAVLVPIYDDEAFGMYAVIAEYEYVEGGTGSFLDRHEKSIQEEKEERRLEVKKGLDDMFNAKGYNLPNHNHVGPQNNLPEHDHGFNTKEYNLPNHNHEGPQNNLPQHEHGVLVSLTEEEADNLAGHYITDDVCEATLGHAEYMKRRDAMFQKTGRVQRDGPSPEDMKNLAK